MRSPGRHRPKLVTKQAPAAGVAICGIAPFYFDVFPRPVEESQMAGLTPLLMTY